jgi:hypothetical protein
MVRSTMRRGLVRALCTLSAFLPAAPAVLEASPPLDPARQYHVRAPGSMMVRGPRCCGTTRFTGELESAYAIRSTGETTLTRLSFLLDDASVSVDSGFLGLFSRRIHLRCAGVSTTGPALGHFDGVDKVDFPAGAIRLAGASAEERLPDGSCAAPSLALDAVNDAPAAFRHNPAANRFFLLGTFAARIEGDTYLFDVTASGGFDNRPPVTGVGIETPQVTQGNCPAFWRWNGQLWERVAQANDPAGLVGTLRSNGSDPDPPGGRGDVLADRWFRTRGAGGVRERAGDGYRAGPVTFEWGPEHRVEVLTLDHAAASAAASCTFRVIDTLAPIVTPPVPITLGCTQPGGASGGTSGPLYAFLRGGHADDLGDATPVPLAPQSGGVTVTDATLFPADGWPRTVRFGFRDRWGNAGYANSSVTVDDTVPPSLSVTLTPALLPANLKYYWITATLTGTDDCGLPLTYKLVKIKSNAPAYDAGDILNVSYGTDDRGFYLFSRPAAPGVARIYNVMYQAIDASGNVKTVTAQVVVG